MAEAPFRGQKSVSAGGDEQSRFSLVRGIGVKVKLVERGESPSDLPSPLGTQDLIFVSPPRETACATPYLIFSWARGFGGCRKYGLMLRNRHCRSSKRLSIPS